MPPLGYRKRENTGCAVLGCDKPVRYVGLCGMHYKRRWRHGDVDTTLIDMEPRTAHCEALHCNNTVYTNASDLCKKHYLRLWRYGRIFNIKADPGTGYISVEGYRVYSINGARVQEHTLLAEAALGRQLPKEAVVHHMNENKLDNFTPLNLVICPNQAYHLLLHRRTKEMKISWKQMRSAGETLKREE